jgi:predicted dehydrogenase
MKSFFTLCLLAATIMTTAQSNKPLLIAVDGLAHDHVHGLLGRAKDNDIQIIGIAEPNRELAERYLKRYNLPPSLLYPSLAELLKQQKPDAVAAFNSIYGHLSTVQQCAPLGIHVMVEKPLAVSVAHAKEMEALARRHKIFLLTNYETTWYGSNDRLYGLLDSLGGVRKVVVHDGHQGPKEIGVSKEFLAWLTDPVLNGGGAVIDFGCYGANLMTWLMKGQRPTSVFAVTQQFKPDVYPEVDDEATIVLTYPTAQAIVQASWNWPYGRKDMEVYGRTGYAISDRNGIRIRASEKSEEVFEKLPIRPKPFHDPFAYLAAVIRGKTKPDEADLSSLQNNLVVVEILEAARQSAKEGRRIDLK